MAPSIRIVAVVLLVALWVGVGWSDGSPPPNGAAARLLATQKAALSLAPELRAVQEELAADVAALEAEGGAGTPYFEVQSEGIGSSFSREPNAQDTVRFGMPFNLPWQASRARRLTDAAGLHKATAGRLAELETVSSVGAEWLRLALLMESLQVVEHRLQRLEAAVELQRHRLRLGEVSGTEVMQLELARAEEASRVAARRIELEACRDGLRMLCGDACEPPVPGDLEQLVGGNELGSPAAAQNGIDASPWSRTAVLERDLAAARADLLSSTVWGRPTAEAQWEHFPSMEGVDGYDAIGLRLSVPLPMGRAGQRQKDEALARARAADARAEARRRAVERRVSAARSAANGAEERLRALEPVVGELARTEHSLSEQFRLGAVSYLVYIDGLARLDSLRLDVADARHALVAAHLELAVLLDDPGLAPLAPSMLIEVDEESMQ